MSVGRLCLFDLYDIFKDKKIERKLFRKKLEALEPGTKDWMDVWNANPELQEKMIEYSKNKYVFCNQRGQRVAFLVCYSKCEEKCFEQKF